MFLLRGRTDEGKPWNEMSNCIEKRTGQAMGVLLIYMTLLLKQKRNRKGSDKMKPKGTE